MNTKLITMLVLLLLAACGGGDPAPTNPNGCNVITEQTDTVVTEQTNSNHATMLITVPGPRFCRDKGTEYVSAFLRVRHVQEVFANYQVLVVGIEVYDKTNGLLFTEERAQLSDGRVTTVDAYMHRYLNVLEGADNQLTVKLRVQAFDHGDSRQLPILTRATTTTEWTVDVWPQQPRI